MKAPKAAKDQEVPKIQRRSRRTATSTRNTAEPRLPPTRFDIATALPRLRAASAQWNAPVVTFIALQTGDPFRVLISCLLSLRTKDETTGPASQRLFALADSPAELLRLPVRDIEHAIYPVGFYHTKAKTILEISQALIARYAGKVPDDLDELLTLKGVGRKTANLVLTQGFGKDAMCVDTHVHRISNRWGYVRTKDPLATEMALRKKLPREHWMYYNDLLVAFGQTICQPLSPKCSICPIHVGCPRRGVTHQR